AMGGNPGAVEVNVSFPNACKDHMACGNAGEVDIVYQDASSGVTYVWEVKSANIAAKGVEDEAFYVSVLNAQGYNAQPGFALDTTVSARADGGYTLVGWDGPAPGTILYKAYKNRDPKKLAQNEMTNPEIAKAQAKGYAKAAARLPYLYGPGEGPCGDCQ